MHGDEVSCEDYKGMTAEVVMECFGGLLPAYRAPCNEYNLNACQVADLAQLGKTPEAILNIIDGEGAWHDCPRAFNSWPDPKGF